MPKRSGKKKDLNELAFSIVQQFTGQASKEKPEREKNPAAVALGRLGGLRSGVARARKLTSTAQRKRAQGCSNTLEKARD